MTTPLLQTLGQVISLLVSTGAIGAFVKAILTARARKKAGVEPRDGKRRLDLVQQNGQLRYALYEQREYCLAEHHVKPSDLPALPAFLKEPA